MEKLTNKEEEIMHVLWKLEKAFVKEVVAELPNPIGFFGHIVFVTDEVGGPVLSFSDNLEWRRWTDRVIVS